MIRNVWGLQNHPFRTLRVIKLEKDRSQELLVGLLPILVLGLGVGGVVVGRRMIQAPMEWGGLARGVSFMVMLFALMVGGYLVYWWREVNRVSRRRERDE